MEDFNLRHDLSAPRRQSKREVMKRGYVACVACRRRKVKCAIETEPPCAKCKREHRQCVFESGSRNPHQREPPRWARQGSHNDPSISDTPTDSREIASETNSTSLVVGGVDQQSWSPQEIRLLGLGTDQTTLAANSDPFQQRNPEVGGPSLSERVVSMALNRPADALEVLFDAVHPDLRPSAQDNAKDIPNGTRLQPLFSSQDDDAVTRDMTDPGQKPLVESNMIVRLSVPDNDTLDWWDKCRFVRMGWLTGQEATTYLDLFYIYIAPLAPVVSSQFRDHSQHRHLITHEPMLLTTALMISSRFFMLPGAGGVSRTHHLHQKLWSFCEYLIRRVMCGQEKYSTAKVRILGTIESFMLIADWHPRSLHFPPETEGWDGELIQDNYDRHNRLQNQGQAPFIRWREDVIEPARRSNRMSWMLLGAATNLACELGIFTNNIDQTLQGIVSESRTVRLRRLLYCYVTQLSVRLGITPLLPHNISEYITPPSPVATNVNKVDTRDSFIAAWLELVQLTQIASTIFFQSAASTKRQLLNGDYISLLNHFSPSLTKWHDNFLSESTDLPQNLKCLLEIEYQYLRVYTSALSVQAIVERAILRGITDIVRNHEQVQSTCFHHADHKNIRDVVSCSQRVLQIATAMGQTGKLRFCPLRTLLCVTSSSILLLKALSLGARYSDLQTALSILEECIQALRASPIDDMDFSARYATLLEKHVATFRANFTTPGSGEQSPGVQSFPYSTSVAMEQTSASNGLPPLSQVTAPQNDNINFNEFSAIGMNSPTDNDWWVQPFNSTLAPFSTNGGQISLGFELDSLDFLWEAADGAAI